MMIENPYIKELHDLIRRNPDCITTEILDLRKKSDEFVRSRIIDEYQNLKEKKIRGEEQMRLF